MATYKPKKKIDNNGATEEILLPISSVDGLQTKLDDKVNKSGDTMTGNLVIQDGKSINVSQYNDAGGVSLMNNGGGNATQFGSSSRPARMFSSVQPEWYKNGASQGVLAIKSDIPTKTSQLTNDSGFLTSHLTSINGLSGGELTSPLVISGGDSATAHKISLNQANSGQITDSSTSTIFGFLNSSQLTVGGNSYALNLRGNGTRPTYKGSDMALKSDIPDVTNSVTNGSTAVVTSGGVYTAISNLPKPMVYKGTLGTGGTITSLPTASAENEGYTYKVITDGTYASQTAKVGDVFVSNGSVWTLIPAGDDVEDTWRNIKVNGTELCGTNISSGAVNFKNGSNVTIAGDSASNSITISASQPDISGKQDKLTAGSNISISGNTISATVPTNYVTTDTEQTITSKKTFNGEVKFGNTENFQGYYIKRMIGSLGAGTRYADLDSSYKDGTWHRMWRLRFPSGSSFWGKIKITLYGGYSSFNASGVMSKSITCNFNTSSIYNNVGCYDGLGVNVEQDFRISEAIWNADASAWEVLIWQKNLSGNNSPTIMLECWTTNNTNYINAFNGITKQTVELTQSTSYLSQKASPTGGTKTVEWATLPVYENPLGEEIATMSDLPKVNNGTLTIQKNGTNVQTFTANQSGNVTANITVPTKTSELTNDSGFTTNTGTITGIKMNGSSKGTSGVVDLGTVITAHQDISGKANLAGNNTFTGGQTITGNINGYSVNADGYVKGSWLQAPSTGKAGSNTGKVCVLDGSGWIYYRTPAEIVSDGGGANLDGGNTFSGQQIFQNSNSGAVAECVMNNSAWDSFTVRNTSDNTQKTAISSGYVWCQDSDAIYSRFNATSIYYGNDTSGYEGTLKFPTDISGENTIMATPTTWSTGTSGSVTLPSGGLYEVKTTYQNTLYHFVVYWDGASSTTSEISITDIQQVGDFIFVSINPKGIIGLHLLNIAGQGADLRQVISYRKIGIA